MCSALLTLCSIVSRFWENAFSCGHIYAAYCSLLLVCVTGCSSFSKITVGLLDLWVRNYSWTANALLVGSLMATGITQFLCISHSCQQGILKMALMSLGKGFKSYSKWKYHQGELQGLTIRTVQWPGGPWDTDLVQFNDQSLDQHQRWVSRHIIFHIVIFLFFFFYFAWTEEPLRHFPTLADFLTNQSTRILQVAHRIMWSRHDSQCFKLHRKRKQKLCCFCCGRRGFLGGENDKSIL